MFYHTVVLHLFRPFLKVEIIDSDIRPRDICIQKANEVSELLRLYRKHYDLRACTLVLTHILLSVSIVHLIFPQSTGNFVQSLKALEDMSVCHYFGARSYKIVHTLAKTWNLPWPEELQLSTIVPKEEASLDSGEPLFQTHTASPPQEMTSNGYTELAPPGAPERRESHSMFALEHQTPDAPSMPGNIQSPPIHFGEQQHRLIQQAQPGAPTFQFGTGNAVPLQAGAGSSSEHADMLFWTPAPGFGLPILPRDFSTGPMDLNNMLATTNEWDRFGRDGFKLSEDWNAQELAMGYGNTMSNPNMGMANNLGAHGTASGAEASAYAVSTNNVAYSDANATSTGVHSMAPSGPGFQSWEWNSGDNTAGSKFNRGGA